MTNIINDIIFIPVLLIKLLTTIKIGDNDLKNSAEYKMNTSKSQSEVIDLAKSAGLKIIEINHADNDYPKGLGEFGIIDFENFEDAEKFANENGCEVHRFQTRDGWHFWHDKGSAFEPYEAENFIEKLGDNYYEASEEQEADLIRDTNLEGQELIEFLKERIKILEELEKANKNQVVICGYGRYYDTVDSTMMAFSEDVYTYAIGVLVPNDYEEE